MYIIGFISEQAPRVLVNPIPCSSMDDLYKWLSEYLNDKDFRLDPPITQEGLEQALQAGKPVRVEFNGYKAVLLLGPAELIYQVTDSFRHIEELNL